MKELVATASNFYFVPDGEGGLTPGVELLLIVSEPGYNAEMANDRVTLTRRRETETLRVCCSPASLGLLLKSTVELMDQIKEQLERLQPATAAPGDERES